MLRQYLIQNINMALDPDVGETSYTNSFDIKVSNDGFSWIPRMPSTFIVNDVLYEKIFEIANVALFPKYTLLKQNGAYIISEDTDDIHIQRSLFFPWLKGTPERLVLKDGEAYHINKNHSIPLMKNLTLNYDHVTSMAIAGNSGSGKTYFLTYLLEKLLPFSELVIIDPKMDQPSRWARKHKILVLFPDANRSKADFISQVNDKLAFACKLIHIRQNQLYINPSLKFKHYTVVIDEVLALTEGIPKAIKDAFFTLLTQIALMGRATNIHLILISQRFDHLTTPIAVREQLNVLVQIGNISSKTTQFLFPDLNPQGIVIPQEIGTGLIQIIDPDHPYQVLPFLTPTYE